ncbi:putative NADH oxidase (plasmid) [Peptoclostridium acidaminophilum DSM 3953]|uniref:Putative NADH oxidase n=1 Tax=Peptoclostridium acidaminophilum DSM 3953 TaxID=1286171 RepID=W8T801_PEPAC|nr:FAD-dependent oxidoreductase [Peptoclostridium acidaminophilum]AHM57854.1 putative NADH oxidase [Peptoclostridium acidaminophilum DSM 3953]
MKKTDLLVIGGSAGGILSATTARKAYGDIDITIIRDTEKVMVPCGIPYIFGTLHDTNKNVIPDAGILEANINLIIDRVVKVDREAKRVTTEGGETIEYKKLVLATGSLPIIPTFIPGYDLENIYGVLKNQNYLNGVLEKVNGAENVAVIGGGFIGVEFAEQMRILGKNVTLIELADACLWQAFDKSFTDEIEASLKENGIKLLTGTKVTKFIGDKAVEAVELANGEQIPADLVILGLGVKPNAELAKEAGLPINARGAIVVDQYTRTNDPDIFAVGDCSEKRCYFTGQDAPVLLASTAAMEAKIAGSNAFQLRLVRANKGTISAFSTQIFGRTYAAAGLTEARARQEGFSMMVGEFTTMDRHPGSLPGAQKTTIKLMFSKCSGVILGAQISGGEAVGEMINILSLAIQKGTTATELNTFQVATHPLLSASPIAYPINAAAMNAIASNCRHLNEGLEI